VRPSSFCHPIVPSVAIAAASVLTLAVLGSCSKLPLVGGDPELKIKLAATEKCNSCGESTGYPVTVRVLQVTDASGLSGASLVQVWDREDQLLGDAMLGKPVQDVLDPGTNREWKIGRDPKAAAVVVMGNFCKTEGSCWFFVRKLEGGGGASLDLYLDESCVREVRR
jgi:type VI secretion system VasD/TssJ family lipoprotein